MIFTEMSNFTDGTNDGNHFGNMYHIFFDVKTYLL